MSHKLNPAAVRVENNLLLDRGLRCLSCNRKHCAHRANLCPLHVLHIVHIPEFFRVINVNVPVIEVDRLILVHAQEVCTLSLLYYFTIILFVINTREHSLLVKFHCVERRFQLILANQCKRCFLHC